MIIIDKDKRKFLICAKNKVRTVRPDTPAFHAGIKANDFITRINGRIVFHLTMKDVERLIRTSGLFCLYESIID